MEVNALKKFKTYLEYELNRKCYSEDYREVLKHFLKQANNLITPSRAVETPKERNGSAR